MPDQTSAPSGRPIVPDNVQPSATFFPGEVATRIAKALGVTPRREQTQSALVAELGITPGMFRTALSTLVGGALVNVHESAVRAVSLTAAGRSFVEQHLQGAGGLSA